MRPAIALLLLVGCATDPAAEPPPVTDPTDDDEDGIADQLEDQLMLRFGPELRLAPDDKDWTRPANVDWYLERVTLRFDQSGCPDDDVLDRGAITLANLEAQRQFKKQAGTGLCRRSDNPDDERFSNKKHLEFFLQATDDGETHPGIPPERSAEWRAYTQVRPSKYPGAAYDLQVWYFFPFNDNIALANHEADWEHMTLSISESQELVSVFYATHGDGHRIDDLAQLQFVEDTHVVGYIADGSHATYEKAGDHPGPAVDDHAYEGGPVWHTWTNFKNLGQIGHVLNDQTWARYGGRWGEVGQTDITSGPPGPMFNSKWDTEREYTQ